MTSCLCAYIPASERARGRVCAPCTNGRQGSLFASVPRPELLTSTTGTLSPDEVPPEGALGRAIGRSDGAAASANPAATNIARIIEAKAGPYTELKGGKPTGRTYQFLELKDGPFLVRYSDGETRPAPPGVTRTFVDDGLRFGTAREVSA